MFMVKILHWSKIDHGVREPSLMTQYLCSKLTPTTGDLLSLLHLIILEFEIFLMSHTCFFMRKPIPLGYESFRNLMIGLINLI